MALPFWSNEPWAWQFIHIGTQQLPGLAKVTATSKMNLDVKKANGASSASLTFRGYDPGVAQIEVRIWSPPQWEAWQTIRGAIWPLPGKKAPTPIDLVHPVLAHHRMIGVLVEEIQGPEEMGNGIYKITMKATEYIPPSKKTSLKTMNKSDPTIHAPLFRADDAEHKPKDLVRDYTGTFRTEKPTLYSAGLPDLTKAAPSQTKAKP